MNLPDIDKVASLVHDSWIKGKRRHNITSHLDRVTGEELMRPYADLSEHGQSLDRDMVITVYDAIKQEAGG